MDNEYKNMSNAELKICIETLSNKFENKKNALIDICKEMEKTEKEFLKAKNELEIRKNLFI